VGRRYVVSIDTLLKQLAGHGVELWFESDRLRFRAPKGALSAEQRSQLSASKALVVAHLRNEAGKSHATFPQSFSQRSLWFLHCQAPESIAYHVAFPVRILSAVNPDALRHAVQALIDRHAILRTTYGFMDDAPLQIVAGARDATCESRDVAGLADEQLRREIQTDFRRPFDLEGGPVLRTCLYTRAADEHVLVLTIHHIAADAWSLLILFQELTKLYEEFTGGKTAGLPRPAVTYAQYSAWQDEMLRGPEGERLWQYWRTKLAAPRARLMLPSDRPRPQQQSSRGAEVSFALPSAQVEKLKALARQENTTNFVILLACFHAFLHRLTEQDDVIVGTPAFARSKSEFSSVVGDFVNTLPLRARVDPSMSMRALIGQQRESLHGALDAQEFPLPLLVERLQPERDAGRTPLFDAFFSLHRLDQFQDLAKLMLGSDTNAVVDSGTLRLAPYELQQQEGLFDLSLIIAERNSELLGVFKYSPDMFDATTMSRWAAGYASLVEAVIADPDCAVASLPRPSVSTLPAHDAAAVLEALARRDVRLWLDGDRLRVNAPKGVLDDTLRNLIGSRKEEFIAALKSGKDSGARDAIPLLPRVGSLPVSSVQQRLWFLDRMDPGSPVYNIGFGVRFNGALNGAVVNQALDQLVARHESLRMRIVELEGTPVVQVLPAQRADFEVINLEHLPAAAREAENVRHQTECLRAPFDLARGPLGRFRLLRLQPDDHVLCICMHHAVSDGWSNVIALNEFCRIYESLVAGRAPQLPPLPVQYADFAGWESEQLQSGRMAAHLAFWKQQLAGVPAVIELPWDRPRPAVLSPRGSRVRRDLEARLLQALKELGRREGATLYMTLLAVWQVLLHRVSGQEDIVVGSPVANRDRAALQSVIGCLVNNVALRGNFAGNPRFSEHLARLKQTTLDAFEHAELPFDVVVDGVSPERSASHAPLFQVLFTLMSFSTMAGSSGVAPPPGLTTELIESDTGTSRFDLTVELLEMDGHLRVGYEYASDLFDESTIARLHSHFESLLAAIVLDPSRRVQELPLLSREQQRVLLTDWNDTTLEHDRGRCVHNLFERTARDRPNAVAVSDEFSAVTFGELELRANQLAHLMLARGVASGARVGICLDRTIDMPLALIAVLKCGAAYVPLDPAHPIDRIRYTLADADVACVITLAAFVGQLDNSNAPLLLLDELQADLALQPSSAPDVPISPNDVAYAIYTSGSTGRPKGVEVEHRNVVSFLEAMRHEPGMCEKDVLLAVTTLSFDIAGLEMWLPLTVGARIVIASRTDVLDGHRLAALMRTHGVTLLQATPATWRLLIDSGWTGHRELKALCGGEPLPVDLAALLLDRVGELWNVYGPTETTIWSTLYRVRTSQNPLPIGRPIANTRVYVLEPSGAPAPVGVAGELCIAGEGVARGYRNRPELTAEKFASITLLNGTTERVYRTGDMARWRADGQLEFLGRNDTQVKVRGYRIELGEIETVLSTHPGVVQGVVVVREDTPGDQRLVGYIVTTPGTAFDGDSARSTLRTSLPEYMIPNLFMTVESLPLTPNGKIDRKMLPKPQGVPASFRKSVPDSASVLMTLPQQRVAAVWRGVLKVEHVGLYNNFFDLGGHSLLLVKLQTALEREFGRDLALVELFQRTTVAAQAERLSSPTVDSDALKRAQARAAKQVRV
jgi:amino acid adenylation domain-containing protein